MTSERVIEMTSETTIDFVGIPRWILQKPERWKKVGLLVDQAIFVGKLEEVRNIRNKVMHFNPNGLASEDLNKLREFAGLLRKIQEAMK